MAKKLLATCSYTRSGNETAGAGAGIALWNLDVQSAELNLLCDLKVDSPSFLCWHPSKPVLYAVHEDAPARVSAYLVKADNLDDPNQAELEPLGEIQLTGSGACHVAVNQRGRYLFTTNYESGEVETIRLDDAGVPVEVTDVDDHRNYGRTKVARPHQSVVIENNHLMVTDPGLDRVFEYVQADDGHIDLDAEITFERGSGPRHIVADDHADAFYAACELNGTIVAVQRAHQPADTQIKTENRWRVQQGRNASETGIENRPSHIALSQRENYLAVANRGPNTISAFSLGGMLPELVDEVPVGKNPRHFAVVKDLLLVASPDDGRIDLLRWGRDGHFTKAAEPVNCPAVYCVAPRKRP